MASRFRIYWRRGRQLLKLPPLDRYAPPPPPPEPVSAWTPYFKRTDKATHRRTPEESPHNPAHPASPLPPFAFGAVTPATSIKRREIRRVRIPETFHYGKALTTRITHLAASVLYGQGPPATRITHLTAAALYDQAPPAARITHLTVQVLYRTPKSQGNPETNPPKPKKKKQKWGFLGGKTGSYRRIIVLQPGSFPPTPPGFFAGQYPSFIPRGFFRTSFERRLVTPLELDEYPPSPVSVVAETAALTANFSAFSRQIQTLELDEYPETPLPTIPFAALDLLLDAHLVEFNRHIQKLPQLDERPPTPPRFFEGFFPAAVRLKRIPSTYGRESQVPLELDERPATPPGFRWPRPPMPTHKVAFARALQTLAHNPAYPPTPPRFFEGFFPAAVRLKRIPSTYGREAQVPAELDERPPTPPRFFEGFWPSQKPFPTFKIGFDRQRQTLPQLDRYKPPPVSDENYSGYTPVSTFRVSFTVALQTLGNPHVYPATPAGFRWPRPPMPTLTASFDRQIQRLELNEYPATPPGFFEGHFPAPIRLKRIPRTYHRDAQRPLNPHVYPATPAGFFNGQWPSHKPFPTFKVSFDRKLLTPAEIDEYPPPPVSSEDYGGYTPVTKFSWSYKRTLQTIELDERPPTPAGFFDGFYPGSAGVRALRASFTRVLISLPQLDERPPTPPPQPAVKAHRVSFTRKRRALAHNPAYPPTPLGFFDGFYPGSGRVNAHLVSADTTRQQLPQHDEWAQIPPPQGITASLRVEDSIKSAFQRHLAKLPQHDEWARPPPSIIEGMAMWAAMSIYRRDIKRTLQPVWASSAVGPAPFVAGLTSCWIADPEEIVWTAGEPTFEWQADCSPTNWKASATYLEWQADCAPTTWKADDPC